MLKTLNADGTVARDKRNEHRVTTSGSRAMRVKREDVDTDGDVTMAGGTSIKRENGGYVSSEDDVDGDLPRQDIDFIEISSGEDEAGSSNRKSKSQRSRGTPGLLPVRIGRREHPERVVGINTEASSESAAKILLEAEAAGTEIKVEDGATAPRKGKGKIKDVEITGVRKPYRGMWSESEEQRLQVKAEPLSDDEGHMPGVETVNISEQSADQEPVKPPVASPETEKRAKLRARAHAEPTMQTDEERAEYARWQANLEAIRVELGPPDDSLTETESEATPKNVNAPAAAPNQNIRDNNTYLFHFPPKMPNVTPSTIKQEPHESAHAVPAQASTSSATKSKEEEKEKERNRPIHGMNVAPGRAGKIRVHESGRATLSWGGERFELTPGQEVSFMQETVDWEYVPKRMRVVRTEAGDSTAFGRVKGKFVVVPSWTKMLK